MAIMRKAGNIPDAMTVLDRLTDVNTRIDSVQGQITASANTVMFSTITVDIAAQPRTRRHVVVPPPRRTSSGVWQPGRDVASALSNLGAALRAIITVAIYAVVYLALPAALAGLALLSRRARCRGGRAAARHAALEPTLESAWQGTDLMAEAAATADLSRPHAPELRPRCRPHPRRPRRFPPRHPRPA